MKLKNFLAMMAVAFLATGFTSCDDDDENNGGLTPPAETKSDLSGDYFGIKTYKMKGNDKIDSLCLCSVIAENDGEYTIELPKSFKNSQMKMPLVTMKNVKFVKDGAHTFTSNIDSTIVYDAISQMNPGTLDTCTINNFKAIINEVDGSCKMVYSITVKSMGFAFNYTFDMGKISGSYIGNNTMIVNDPTQPTVDSLAVSTITSNGDGTINITLPEKQKTAKGMEMPAVVLKNLKIKTVDANEFTFTMPTDRDTIKSEMGDGTTMSVIVKDVKATMKANKFNFMFTMKPGGMPFFIKNNFVGIPKK